MIFIYGDSFKNHIAAIVVPEPATLEPYCVANNLGKFQINRVDGSSLAAIIKHP